MNFALVYAHVCVCGLCDAVWERGRVAMKLHGIHRNIRFFSERVSRVCACGRMMAVVSFQWVVNEHESHSIRISRASHCGLGNARTHTVAHIFAMCVGWIGNVYRWAYRHDFSGTVPQDFTLTRVTVNLHKYLVETYIYCQ